MLRSEAVARIQRGLGFRTDLDDAIVASLKEAQRLLEVGRTLPSFLLAEDQSLVVAIGSGGTNLPLGFIKEAEQGQLRYADPTASKYTPLEKITFTEAKERFFSDAPGKPKAYALRSGNVDVFPERDVEYTLTWDYYKRAVALDSDLENEWLVDVPAAGGKLGDPEGLIGRAGIIIASDLRNQKALSLFQTMFADSWAGRMAYDIEREQVNNPVRIGGQL